jgi:hypothetical protein
MPRFNLGDHVRICAAPTSPFAGAEGVVHEVTPHPKNLTQLDSYVVVFAWGEKQTFWDAHLQSSTAKDNR